MHRLMLFIHSLNKYCLCSYYVLVTLLCFLDTLVNKAGMILAQNKYIYSLVEEKVRAFLIKQNMINFQSDSCILTTYVKQFIPKNHIKRKSCPYPHGINFLKKIFDK